MALDAHWNFSGCNDGGGGGEQISSPFPIPSSLMLRQYFVLFLVIPFYFVVELFVITYITPVSSLGAETMVCSFLHFF